MKYFLIILTIIIVTIAFQASVFGWKVMIGKMLAKNTQPFSYHPENPNKRILVIGDSTAYGTGTQNPEQSTAGYFHQDFPEAEIVNISKNGAKTKDLKEMIKKAQGEFDLVLVQAGANDIIYFNPLEQSKDTMDQLLKEAKKYSNNVVLLTAGNIGAAPIFPIPLNWIYTNRAKKYLPEFKAIADSNNVAVVDLFLTKENDVFSQNIDKYYASDHLHLSGAGYKLWYESIRKTMEQAHIKL